MNSSTYLKGQSRKKRAEREMEAGGRNLKRYQKENMETEEEREIMGASKEKIK